jgi:hypothetical protein
MDDSLEDNELKEKIKKADLDAWVIEKGRLKVSVL